VLQQVHLQIDTSGADLLENVYPGNRYEGSSCRCPSRNAEFWDPALLSMGADSFDAVALRPRDVNGARSSPAEGGKAGEYGRGVGVGANEDTWRKTVTSFIAMASRDIDSRRSDDSGCDIEKLFSDWRACTTIYTKTSEACQKT
jgi:hypothetical protein